MDERAQKYQRSDLLEEQVVLRRRVKIKSTLAPGGSCQVVKVKRNSDDNDWEEVGDEFRAYAFLQFEAPYDPEGDPIYGLVEYWPDRRKWEFYQLDFECGDEPEPAE